MTDEAKMKVYDKGDIEHEADYSNPIQHGVIRYIPTDDVSPEIRNQLPSKNDRPFVYVPVGYVRRNKDDYINNILKVLNLALPNIVVVTPETTGTIEEQFAESYQVQDAASHPVAKNWTTEEQKEVLKAKAQSNLETILESSMEVGAWLLPDAPRRKNGAAQFICNLLPKYTIPDASGEISTNVALGLIGLGEEEQDKDFKEVLTEAMAPIGSPVKNVVNLVFDLNLKDGAPLPQLTHMIIFESPEEKIIFKQAIIDLVPDFLVAFGNITRNAMHDVFSTVKANSPIVVIQHTGSNIHKLTTMFRHVKKSLISGQSQGVVPPLVSEDDELIKLFINTWPLNFNKDSVVLSDPLITTGQKVQKRLLAAIAACFSLKTGGVDSSLVRHKALKYAWAFFDAANKHSKKKKSSCETLQVELNLFTLASIVTSVVYNQIYGTVKPQNSVQLIIYMSTILLPLCITALQQESSNGSSFKKWRAFKLASYKIYSEIYKFRTQSGIYRVQEKTEIALQKPIEEFTIAIQKIWINVKPYLEEDRLSLPKDFWDSDEGFDMSKFSVETLTVSSPTTEETSNPTPIESSDLTTPLLEATQKDDHDDEDPPEAKFVDDRYSPIKVDDYITCRMQTIMNKSNAQIGSMVFKNGTLVFLIKLITIFSGGLAALSLQWAVPIVLGVTASLGTVQNFRRYSDRIDLGNDMVVDLNALRLWWMGLTMYEKQLPQNKDHLVLQSEQIIIAELKTSFGQDQKEKNTEESS